MADMETEKPNQRQCPWCGGTEFVEGWLIATPFFAFFQNWRLWPMFVMAIRCQSCGYLFAFAGRPKAPR
jgi:predicted nucleic-acid-binding Zn-ribbon protein